MENQLKKLAELFAADKEISLDEATKRTTDAFYEVLPTPGGSAQTHEVLEYANNVFDDEVQERQADEKVHSGYYNISAQTVIDGMAAFVTVHRGDKLPKIDKDILYKKLLSEEQFTIFKHLNSDNQPYLESVLDDLFNADEIPNILSHYSDLEILVKPVYEQSLCSGDSSRTAFSFDITPKDGGYMFIHGNGYFNCVVSFRDEKKSFLSSNVPF